MAAELKRKLDYSDYLAAPDDGKRYEIIRGDLHVTPAPNPVHQRISGRLYRLLSDYCASHGLGEVFYSPIDLILTSQDVVQPDLLVVGEPGHVTKRGIEGPPLLVVEIISPSTRKQDLGVKAQRYAELGIPHYWVVDPEGKSLECHRNADGAYRRVTGGRDEARLEHPDWEGLAIDLAALWR